MQRHSEECVGKQKERGDLFATAQSCTLITVLLKKVPKNREEFYELKTLTELTITWDV